MMWINYLINLMKYKLKGSKNLITICPETKNCIVFLRKNNIKTGTTTGFNKENMEIIKDKLENSNVFIDSYVPPV